MPLDSCGKEPVVILLPGGCRDGATKTVLARRSPSPRHAGRVIAQRAHIGRGKRFNRSICAESAETALLCPRALWPSRPTASS